ncbi:MAG TPA: hypothetical protein VNO52_15600 [Methylomirabilota bacterium]|nr:hypothetical protein [Methylomirabilota bacterium]
MPLGHPFDRTYCIGLACCGERREHAARELGRSGCHDFQFFDPPDHEGSLVAEYRQRGLVPGFRLASVAVGASATAPTMCPLIAQVATFITHLRLWGGFCGTMQVWPGLWKPTSSSTTTRRQLAAFCQRHGYPKPVQLACCA